MINILFRCLTILFASSFAFSQVTVESDCPNIGNPKAFGSKPNIATFTWDDSNGAYEFVRIKIRVDTVSDPKDFIRMGGFGIAHGIFTSSKKGLIPGQTYTAHAKTWCNPQGGPNNSGFWTSFGVWTQPKSMIVRRDVIKNLDVFPNPSKDVFKITFTCDEVQTLRIKLLNVIGEEIIVEYLEQFTGKYMKQIDLKENGKGIYLLEIETNGGKFNKELILK
tara:strand:+ start:6500 stop:7162 length:663 start_codon:yes stop_codon:yes gene_type:complete